MDDQTTRLNQGYGARIGFDLDEKDAFSAEENARRLVMEGRKGKLYELKPDKFLAEDHDDVWTAENVQEAAVEVLTQLMMSKVTRIDVVAQCFNCEFRAICLIERAHRYRLKLVNRVTGHYEYFKLNDRRLGKIVNADRDMIYWGGNDKDWPWDVRMRYQNLEETADNTLKLSAALIERPMADSDNGLYRKGLTVDGFCEFDLSFKYRCQGSFTEQMNLQNYPFDSQRLCIRIILLRPYQLSSKRIEDHALGEARFRVDAENRPSLVDPFNFAMDNQWTMLTYNPKKELRQSYKQLRKRETAGIASAWTCVRMGSQLTTTHPKFDITPGLPNRQVFSKLKISLAIRRRTLHFVYEYILPMFFLTLLSATSFAIEAESPDRLMVVTTFVLAVVLFNNGAMTHIPPISYTSWLGAYKLVCCEVPLALMMVQAVSVKAYERLGVKDLEEFEYWTVMSWVVYFFIANFGFLVWAITIIYDATPSFTGPSTTVEHRDYLEQLVAAGAPIPLGYSDAWKNQICSTCKRVPRRLLPDWRINTDGRRPGWSKIGRSTSLSDHGADVCGAC